MVELLSEGRINSQWKPYIEKAGKYLDKFDPQGKEPYTCESPHFSSPNTTSYSSANNKSNFGDATVIVDEDNGGILMGLGIETATGEIDLGAVQLLFDIPNTLTGTLSKIFNTLKKLGLIAIDTNRLGNGYWIIPKIEKDPDTEAITSTSLEIATRLSYKITGLGSESASEIIQALNEDFGVQIPDAVINWTPDDFAITFAETTTLAIGEEPERVSTVTVKLPNVKGFVLYVSQTGDETTAALKQETNPDSDPSRLLGDLNSFTDAPPADDALPGDFFKTIRLWYADVNTGKNWTIALILNLPIGDGVEGELPIYLKYDKEKRTFEGGILRGDLPEESEINLPSYREWQGLPKDIVEANEQQPYIDLARVFNFTLPKGLPTKMTKGNISYKQKDTQGGKPSLLKVEVELGTGDSAEADPPAPFNWESAAFKFEKEGADVSWHISSIFTLKEKIPTILEDGTTRPDGVLSLDLGREGKKWSLSGSAENINFAMLGAFFDPNLSDALVSVLGKIEIAKLQVDYSYDPNGKASDFLISGDINLGKLQLSLFYQYGSKSSETPEGTKQREDTLRNRSKTALPPPKAVKVPADKETAWEFDAFLSASGRSETIGTIIESLVGENLLPDFISNIDVPTKDVEIGGKPLISIKVAKMDNDRVIFIFDVSIGIVEFSFIQIATNKVAGKKGVPTRVLRLSIGPLPFIEDIPVIQELPQPYQLLTYCFVGGVELKKAEVDFLNKEYIPDSKIYYKSEVQKQTTGLRLGNHFIVINNDECILDHIFSTGQNKPTGTTNAARRLAAPPANDSSTQPDEKENAPTKGALKKQSKFLTITGISVQYKKKTLWLFIDASLKLGPIEMNLIGFGIGIKLSNPGLKLNDLSTFNLKDDLDFQLNGLAMDFDQPPVLIAGVFIHEVTETINSYRGGIAVGFKPYEFVAVGEYAEIQSGSESYKSIFIYAKLDGPLIDLEIAIIKGVRLGLGYNSFVRTPSVQELADFPFINDVGIGGAGNNPMAILTAMRGGDNPWVAPKQDSYWFAVGFSVAAFDIITATAVALLEFSDEGVVVNIFADVIAQMPPEVEEKEQCILYVELLLNAELNFIHDYFFVQAALAPTSFLLVPQCHLFGGFAMGTWFGRSDYAGDWVFTVGGYHRQFNVPDHYPRPERLGIKFNIGDNMTIGGEGYFAITPKAVMGGALIYVQIHVGPVSAHLTAGFDALLQFHPLHYIVDVYVEVGVSCRVHLLFVSFDLSIDIGADLHIEGPNFGGVAHVDFWFFGFDVYFGDQPSLPPPLHLKEFYEIVAKAGPPEETAPTKADDVEKDLVVQLKLALEEGACPMPVKDAEPGAGPDNAGTGSKWRVRGGNFKFRVSSVFAITSATLATKESMALKHGDPTPLEQQVSKVEDVVPVSSIPMQIGPGGFDSSLDITIMKETADEEEKYPGGWQPEFVVKTVPTALWGDPAHPPNALDSKDGTVPQQMAVSILAPLPVLAVSKIPPVNATEINRQLVLEKELAPSETQSELLPATLDKTPKTWPEMQKVWETSASANVDVAKSLVSVCMKTLGWDVPAPEVLMRTKDLLKKPWELVESFPERLVTGTGGRVDGVEDGLANTYLALPRVVAV